MEMSFLCCIGEIMNDSGLQEILQTVYTDNTFGHILTGKVIARARRGPGIVDMALQSLLCAEVFLYLLV